MSHYSVRTGLLCASLLVAIAIAGCEDPSNVGVGIIGEQESEPVRVALAGADLPNEREPLVTGGIRSGSVFTGAGRFLAGIADDPIFGVIDATAYVDFSTPATITEAFRSGTVQSVTLVLTGDGYVYGDTTASARIVISDMDEAWTAFAVRSDTTLTPGDTVASLDFAHTDGNIVVSMPDEWVAAHASELLDENFVDVFNGFQVRALGPTAVIGFDGLNSFMRVTTSTDSLDYPMSKLLTTLLKDPVDAEVGRTPIQDGFGENAVLDFDFAIDSIAGAAISRAVVDVRVDLSVYDSAPVNFFRPQPPTLQIIAIRPDGTRRLLNTATIETDGSVHFQSSTANAGEFTLVRSVQLAVTGNSEFDKYAVAVTEAQAAIGSALLYNASAAESAPSAVVTLVRNPFVP